MLMALKLNIHCFMHAPYEGPGVIADWILKKGHRLSFTRFYEGDSLPDPADVDFLVIMGGPMNVFDFHIHPWMQDEIDWVAAFIRTDRPVLGICLGAQMIAAAMGSDVFPGEYREIGWHNLKCLPCLGDYRICNDLPSVRKVFHWHGDTFQIPEGAFRIAESRAFANQGFIYEGRILALQFHLEVTAEGVRDLVEACGAEIMKGPYIQPVKEILAENSHYRDNHQLMFRFLDYLSGRGAPTATR
jgi:GMP synthase-like glutamine amidotransferase